MNQNKFTYRIILLILLVILFCRVYYYTINYTAFAIHSFGDLLYNFVLGFWFDIPTLMIILSPAFFILLIRIVLTRYWVAYLSTFLFRLGLIIFLIANCVDAHYYRFIFHRALISDVLLIRDSIGTIWHELWHYPVHMIIVLLMIIMVIRVRTYAIPVRKLNSWQLATCSGLIMAYIMLPMFAKVNFSPKHAVFLTPSENTALVTNTPLNIIYSAYYTYVIGLSELIPERHYYDDEYVLTRESTSRQYNRFPEHKYNIVVFLLESFSASFLDSGNTYKASTPFLDSIISQSLYCNHSYSSGINSSTSLSALVTSVPALMNIPFFTSDYNSVQYTSYIEHLDSIGYHTSFFFGGNQDHFGFQKGTRAFGIEHYYCETDFGDPSQHDGIWGIYDGPFSQYFAEQLKLFPQPFFSIFFNLSSHYPFQLPDNAPDSLYHNNKITAHRSIRYVDLILRQFFDSIRHEAWYDNTIFVFVGDHVSKEQDEEHYEKRDKYRVPLFIYKPDGSLKGKTNKIADHTSIGPTIMDMIGYRNVFHAFGQSIFEESHDNTMTLHEVQGYQFIDPHYYVEYNEPLDSIVTMWNYIPSQMIKNNPISRSTLQMHYDSVIKLQLQNFSIRILHNQMQK